MGAEAQAENIFTPAEETPPDEEEFFFDKNYVGQSAEGFLIFDFPGALAVMDPHAAHERILFEDICENFKDNIATQWLTLPMEIPQAAAAEAALYEARASAFARGRMTAIPRSCKVSPIDMLRSVCAAWRRKRPLQTRPRGVVAHGAPRPARRGKLHAVLSPEVLELLRRLERCDTPYTCPHGRPTVFLIENKTTRLVGKIMVKKICCCDNRPTAVGKTSSPRLPPG
ncbi:MAG: hypothetical protein ACLUEQ_09050 [Cloacibacillus evryensis]